MFEASARGLDADADPDPDRERGTAVARVEPGEAVGTLQPHTQAANSQPNPTQLIPSIHPPTAAPSPASKIGLSAAALRQVMLFSSTDTIAGVVHPVHGHQRTVEPHRDGRPRRRAERRRHPRVVADALAAYDERPLAAAKAILVAGSDDDLHDAGAHHRASLHATARHPVSARVVPGEGGALSRELEREMVLVRQRELRVRLPTRLLRRRRRRRRSVIVRAFHFGGFRMFLVFFFLDCSKIKLGAVCVGLL